MTYGDGVCDVNLEKLLAFHKAENALVTLTAVRPPARFGALEFDGTRVRHYKEKSKMHEGRRVSGKPAALPGRRGET